MGLGFGGYLAELAANGFGVGVGGGLQHEPHLGGHVVVERDHLAGGRRRRSGAVRELGRGVGFAVREGFALRRDAGRWRWMESRRVLERVYTA